MAEMVTVACKMASGLHLDLFNAKGERIKRVTVRGNAMAYEPDKILRNPELTGGYAFTQVDKDHWDQWFEMMKDSSIIADGLVFAMPKLDVAKGRAKEQAEIADQFPRLSKDAIASMGVEPADRG